MRIGVCTGIDALKAPVAGVEYIEPGVAALLCPADDEAAFRAVLGKARSAAAPCEAVNCFFPGSLKSTGPDVDPAALDGWVTTCCIRAADAGVGVIVFGSGGSRAVPAGFDRARAAGQIVGNLKRFGRIAGRFGVVIVLEPLNHKDCNIVTSVDEAAELVRSAGDPSVRLLVDTYHMAVDGDPVDSIRRAGDLIAHVHCAEGDGRGPLGTKGEDQRPYFRALKDVGYDGRISLECNWKDLGAQLPGGVAELRKQWEEA